MYSRRGQCRVGTLQAAVISVYLLLCSEISQAWQHCIARVFRMSIFWPFREREREDKCEVMSFESTIKFYIDYVFLQSFVSGKYCFHLQDGSLYSFVKQKQKYETYFFFVHILLPVHLDITSGRWPILRIINLYNTFISILYMFRANTCSSSGGQLH